MEPNVARALERLRDPSGEALKGLAALVVAETMATPIRDVARPRFVASQIAASLQAISQGDVARTFVERRLAEGRTFWKDEQRPVRAWMPKQAEDPLRVLLMSSWSPNQELVLRVIDQPAMRRLVGEVLEETLTRFQNKVKNLDKTGLGRLGMRAARKGKGLFGDLAENLGGLTENLVGAVTEELEHAFEGRIKEFVANATGEAMVNIAQHLADPRYAKEFGELRVGVLDVLLDTPLSELGAEADKLRPAELVDVVIGAIRSTLNEPKFVDDTEARVRAAMEQAGDGTLGAWLDQVGLREVWTDTTTELLVDRLRAIVDGDAFGAWWDGLFTP